MVDPAWMFLSQLVVSHLGYNPNNKVNSTETSEWVIT